MNKNKIKHSIYASTLLVIAILMVVSSPGIVAAQIQNSGKTTFPFDLTPKVEGSWSTMNISDSFTERYLEILGAKSPKAIESTKDTKLSSSLAVNTISKNAVYTSNQQEIAVKDTLTIMAGKESNGYSYTAQFIDSNSNSYKITESQSKKTIGNQVSTTTEQKIEGTFNYSMRSVEKKTIGDTISKQNSISISYENSSRIFGINIQGDSIWNKNESAILSGDLDVYQNLHDPVGEYRVTLTPKENSTALKVTMILPNGTLIDPTLGTIADEVQLIAWDGYDLFVNHLRAWYVYWSTSETVEASGYITILGEILSIWLDPIGVVITVIENLLLAVIDTYDSSTGSLYSYQISVFWEHWYYNPWYGSYLIESQPNYGECGYRTDNYANIYAGQWIFYPTWSFNYPHTGIWPNSGVESLCTLNGQTLTSTEYGSGDWVGNLGSVIGIDDGIGYRIIAFGNTNDGGQIVGSLSRNFGGTVEIHCQVGSSQAHLLVYVSNSASGPWTNIKDVTLGWTYGATWVNCGSGWGSYIAIAAVKAPYSSLDMIIDSVRVESIPCP